MIERPFRPDHQLFCRVRMYWHNRVCLSLVSDNSDDTWSRLQMQSDQESGIQSIELSTQRWKRGLRLGFGREAPPLCYIDTSASSCPLSITSAWVSCARNSNAKAIQSSGSWVSLCPKELEFRFYNFSFKSGWIWHTTELANSNVTQSHLSTYQALHMMVTESL